MRQGPRHTCHRRAPRRSNEQLESYGVDLASVIPNDDGDGIKDGELRILGARAFWANPPKCRSGATCLGFAQRHAASARLVGRPELQFGGAPKVPINTYGPGSDSGTYDFFGEATLCEDCFAGSLGRRFRAFSGLFRLFLSLFLFRSSGRTATTPKASRTAPRTSTAPWSSWPRSRTSPPSSRARGFPEPLPSLDVRCLPRAVGVSLHRPAFKMKRPLNCYMHSESDYQLLQWLSAAPWPNVQGLLEPFLT